VIEVTSKKIPTVLQNVLQELFSLWADATRVGKVNHSEQESKAMQQLLD